MLADPHNEALRVFVVEDSPDLRFLYRLMLEQAGHELVGEAATGRAALADAPDLEPDVLLIDLVLPDGRGSELVPVFRALLPGAAIVLCSGAGPDATRTAAGAGVDGWLDKARIRELVPFLEQVLAERT